MATSITHVIEAAYQAQLRKILETSGYEFKDHQYAFWRAAKQGSTVIFYTSGKLVLQGSRSGEVNDLLSEQGVIQPPEKRHTAQRWIGIDESGKGDYFGPLVVAAVMVEADQLPLLAKMGVRDSKTLSETSIISIAEEIIVTCSMALELFVPAEYNTLYAKISNLNTLLAKGHAKVLEDLLEKKQCDYAISDQFANPAVVQKELQVLGKNIKLEQRHYAEDDPAVACASIMARYVFVNEMRAMGKRFDMTFPKGASSQVVSAGKKFVWKYGANRLNEVAKLHFKTTEKIIH
ncbi:MAG: ribonuclease HIII [Candidatus Auribacter fodinae]|jgi:ribonuclease HIII|uniref:Ribonuclease n=1 Tax=Candidatus Auribacter fodinae TaxID=2093366 RepID=A0A3A4R2R8_9BACT|nr:MAG: ribonuclease HIII [Candidatus Auribacter fodinae]